MISKKSVSALFALVLLLISCSTATDYAEHYIPHSYQTPYSDTLFLSDVFFTSTHSAFVLLLSISSTPVFPGCDCNRPSLPVFL